MPPAAVPPDVEPHVDVDGQVVVNDRLIRLRKLEATSLRHLMTHHPKNIYCRTCCLAKVQHSPHKRKARSSFWKGKPQPNKFGEQITADHIVAYSERSMGVTGDCAAVVFGDRATGWFDGIPIASKTTVDTSSALRHFAGSEKIKRAWPDNSPERIATFAELHIIHDTALQGRPLSNGRAERLVRVHLTALRH